MSRDLGIIGRKKELFFSRFSKNDALIAEYSDKIEQQSQYFLQYEKIFPQYYNDVPQKWNILT